MIHLNVVSADADHGVRGVSASIPPFEMSTPHGSIMIGSAGSNTASRRTGHANVEPNAYEGGSGISTGSEATLSSPEHRSSSSCVSRKSAKFLVLPFGVFGVFAKTPASFDSIGIATQPAFAARSKGDSRGS